MNVLLDKVAGFGKPQAHIPLFRWQFLFSSQPLRFYLPEKYWTVLLALPILSYHLCLSVSKVRTEIGIRSFWFSDPVAWNLPLIAFK